MNSGVAAKFWNTRSTLSIVLILWILFHTVGHLPSYFGGYLPVPQGLAACLFLVLLLMALTPRKGAEKIKWHAFIPLMLALPALIMTGLFFEQIENYEAYGVLDAKGVWVTMSLALGLLWAVWRTTSPVLSILLGGVMLAIRFQNHLPGLLAGRGYGFDRLGYAFFVGSEGVFGIPFHLACSILIMFIIFGQLFERAGGGDWFLQLAGSLIGNSKGGMAKTSVIASFFFGMISGSPAANTATTGAITIPAMKGTGYPPAFAGAVEAVASTGGQIMPPVMGSIAFIMAEWLMIPYSQVVLAAAIPATLYFVMVFAAIHFEAMRNDRVVVRTKDRPEDSFFKVLLEGWFYLVPIVLLIVLLLVVQFRPETAGFYSILSVILCSFMCRDKSRRLLPKRLGVAIVNGVEKWIVVAIITSAVGMMVGSLALSGLGVKFSSFIIDVTGGNLALILLSVALGCFVLGMGLDSIPMYITMAILIAPALQKTGVPDIAAHLFVIYWGMTSFITPPVCIAVYVACGISGADIWRTGGNAVLLGAGFFIIPFAFVFSPALLGMGPASQIVLATVTALIGGVSVASGMMGFGIGRLNVIQRIMQMVGGAALILRDWRFEVLGLCLLLLSVFWQWVELRREKAKPVLGERGLEG